MRIHKFASIFLSYILVIALLVGTCSTAYAVDNVTQSENQSILYDDGETVIEFKEDADGNAIYSQYVDGVLVQRNTIYLTKRSIINREFFNSSSARSIVRDTIDINDYGLLQESQKVSWEAYRASAWKIAGTINYRALLDSGNVYYGLKCSYRTTLISPTTYTVYNYMGSLVDLISLFAGALKAPFEFVNEYITNVIYSLGIAISAGKIKSAFSDTVSCDETDYEWKLVDTTNAGHQKNVTGSKYYRTDVKSVYKGNTYYEGYVSEDWKKESLAIWFHNEMFTYSSWAVVSWS